MKMPLKNKLFCILIVCLIAACDKHTVYHSYQPLPIEGWEKSDTLSFYIPISDSVPPILKIFAEVRNSSKYTYRELYLHISHNIPDTTTWHNSLVALTLADSTATWMGKGWGSLYQSEAFVQSTRPLHPGNYTVKVSSGMSDSNLKGLTDVGIRIEKIGN